MENASNEGNINSASQAIQNNTKLAIREAVHLYNTANRTSNHDTESLPIIENLLIVKKVPV